MITLIVGTVLVLVFAVVFAIAYGSRRITAEAAALHSVDETLLSATVARAQLALAGHAANTDRVFGSNSTGAIAISMEEARVGLSDLDAGMGQLATLDVVINPETIAAVDEFQSAGSRVLALLEDADSVAAQEVALTELGPSFDRVRGALDQTRAELRESVLRSDLNLGRVGNAARFLVAFIVPTAVIVIYRELSRRQQKQGDLERRLAAERTLGKAKDDFVANASHELRTPLTSIYGLALLLEEDPAFDQSETAPELLDMIISEASDLSRMVEDLLTTARLDAGALHYTFENVAVLEEIDEVVGPMSRAGAEITVDCEPGIVRCDRLRLRQVLRNLLSNARKYGGPELRVEGHAEEGKFVFAVVDDGDGIPPEIRDRLFQRYIHKGTQPMILGSVGLGLSIVKALTEGMGGSIHYERRDGHTRFVFAMPLVAVMEPTVVTEAAGNPEFPDVESEGYGVGAPSVEEVGFRGGGSREP